jgi:hypothetical protein
MSMKKRVNNGAVDDADSNDNKSMKRMKGDVDGVDVVDVVDVVEAKTKKAKTKKAMTVSVGRVQMEGGTELPVTLHHFGLRPTVLDLRREILRLNKWGDGARFDLVHKGKLLLNCRQFISASHENVFLVRHRFGGNPRAAAFDTKQECQLLIVEADKATADKATREWSIGPRGHMGYCQCFDRFQYPTLISMDRFLSFEWRVDQDCYCLAQETFNSDNIAVWRMDDGDKPFPVKSVQLQINYANSTYDNYCPNTDGSAAQTICVSRILPSEHGWAFGLYELRFNRPANPENMMHISGFGAQHIAQTLYPGTLTLCFYITPASYDRCQTHLSSILPFFPYDLAPVVIDFLFPSQQYEP